MDSAMFMIFMLGVQVSLLSYWPLALFCVIRVVQQVSISYPEVGTRHLPCRLGSIVRTQVEMVIILICYIFTFYAMANFWTKRSQCLPLVLLAMLVQALSCYNFLSTFLVSSPVLLHPAPPLFSFPALSSTFFSSPISVFLLSLLIAFLAT